MRRFLTLCALALSLFSCSIKQYIHKEGPYICKGEQYSPKGDFLRKADYCVGNPNELKRMQAVLDTARTLNARGKLEEARRYFSRHPEITLQVED